MTDNTTLDIFLVVGPAIIVFVIIFLIYKLRPAKASETAPPAEEEPESDDLDLAEEPAEGTTATEEPEELKGVAPASDADVTEVIAELEKTSHKILSERVEKGEDEES